MKGDPEFAPPRIPRPTLTRSAWRCFLTGRSSRPEEACDNKILPPTPDYTPPPPDAPPGRFMWSKGGWAFVADAEPQPQVVKMPDCIDPKPVDPGVDFGDHIEGVRRRLRDVVEAFGVRAAVYSHTQPQRRGHPHHYAYAHEAFWPWPHQWTVSVAFYLGDDPTELQAEVNLTGRAERGRMFEIEHTRYRCYALHDLHHKFSNKRRQRRWVALRRAMFDAFHSHDSRFFDAVRPDQPLLFAGKTPHERLANFRKQWPCNHHPYVPHHCVEWAARCEVPCEPS